MMRARIRRCANLFVAVLGLSAGAAPAQQPVGGAGHAAGPVLATIVEARPARGVRNGEPIEPSGVFTPDAGRIHVWYRLAGHRAPVSLRGIWHYLGAGQDRVILESDAIFQTGEDRGDFSLELPPGRPWPKGDYRVDLIIAGRPAVSVPFRIDDGFAGTVTAVTVPSLDPSAPSPPAPPPAAGVTVDEVAELLREAGYATERILHEGQPVLMTMIGKHRLLLIFAGCRADRCDGIQFRAAFTARHPIAPATIDAWNRTGPPVTALLDHDGDPTIVSSLELSGTPIAAVREAIAVWREQLPRFVAHLAAQQ